ncbi:MAG: SpaA isopeptide-forming pilin-related protein, partial [Tissierella sp.]|uniref:SpaA isopeptide-forming pilin-related protein n=1 Tax=Tissierella sp. TaxID=41274 RepID=UPI003F972B1A
NIKITGKVVFNKKDNQGNLLSGAKFGLYANDTRELVQEQTSDENGLVEFTNLPLGGYQLKELEAPEGYRTMLSSIGFAIHGDTSDPVKLVRLNDIINPRIIGSVSLTKHDSEGNPLEGAKFGIYDDNGDLVKEETSNSSGLVRFLFIPYGNYVVKEIEAPDGYDVSDETFQVEIKEYGEYINLGEIINEKAKKNVSFTKKDDKDNPLAGAKFGIFDMEYNLIYEQTSDANGIVRFKDVALGNYMVKEIEAPEGYKSSNIARGLNVNEESPNEIQMNGFINKRITGKIILTKKDNKGNLLAGARFGLYDEDGNLVEEQTSDSDGLVEFNDIHVGKYTVKEIEAPEGYIASDETLQARLMGQWSIDDLGEVINKKKGKSIEFIKKDNEGNLVAGAEFGMYYLNGSLYKTVTSNQNGLVRFEDVDLGIYEIKEIEAPEGYIDSNFKQYVFITKNSRKVTKILPFVNKRIRGSVTLTKKDSEGNLLAGARFGIYDEDGNLVEERTSDEDGLVEFNNIPYGDYTVEEIEAPEGYVASPTTFDVSINEHKEVVDLGKVTNIKIKGTVVLTKEDNMDNGNVLAGA